MRSRRRLWTWGVKSRKCFLLVMEDNGVAVKMEWFDRAVWDSWWLELLNGEQTSTPVDLPALNYSSRVARSKWLILMEKAAVRGVRIVSSIRSRNIWYYYIKKLMQMHSKLTYLGSSFNRKNDSDLYVKYNSINLPASSASLIWATSSDPTISDISGRRKKRIVTGIRSRRKSFKTWNKLTQSLIRWISHVYIYMQLNKIFMTLE